MAIERHRGLRSRTAQRGFYPRTIRLPHVGIIRIDGAPDHEHADICAEILERYEEELLAGAFIVSEPGRTRVTNAGGADA